MAYVLEPSPERMHALLRLASERIVNHIESLPRQPTQDVEGAGEFARSLREKAPAQGQPFEDLLDLLFDRVIPKSFNTAGPGYLAYIPAGGLFDSALGELIAGAVNRYVGVFLAAPGLAQLEANVVRWFCDFVGYPPSAQGFLTTGGSLANFTAIVTARSERLPEDFLKGVLYASDQTHHSVRRASRIAGIPAGNVRVVPTDAWYRMRTEELRKQIRRDREEGSTPFLVVGNGGTTNSGAVDDLPAIADLARDEGLWFHVDAAYGGFFVLTDEGRKVLAGMDRADSITLDPHKGLFLPYGTGSLIVRDGGALKRTHAVQADYLPHMQEDEDLVDFCEISPELSRDFRGLRVWLPFKMHGVGAFRDALQEKLELARYATTSLRALPGIEILAEPQLSIVAFRLTRPDLDPPAIDALNRRLLEAINGRKRVFLTSTILKGKFAIRICVLSYRTHKDRLDQGLDDIREAIAAVP
jgi:aromatic-L-amino-acid decarboxylase